MLKTLSVIPVLQIAGAYVAADNMGGLLTFPISSGTQGISAVDIRRLIVIDADIEDAELYLHLYNATPSAVVTTDANTHAPATADMLLKLCSIHVAAADYIDSTGDSIAIIEVDIPVNFDGSNLFGAVECVGTPTYTAVDDLLLKLVVEQ